VVFNAKNSKNTMVDASADLKKLKIKIGVVRRIWKEYYGYNQEEAKQKQRI
jgi:hypothetical protein